eukprot:1796897-Lingulodinium_polyedra.AAC.1
MTLLQRIEKQIDLERSGKKVSWGKTFYSDLRRWYHVQNDEEQALAAAGSRPACSAAKEKPATQAEVAAVPDAKLVRPALFKAGPLAVEMHNLALAVQRP